MILAGSPLGLVVVRLDQLDVTHAERLGKLVERDDGRVAPSAFEAAEVLLAEPGARSTSS